MKAVRVQYKVKPEYVEINKRNVEQVMADVKALNNADLKYCTFQLPDGVSFMHLSFAANEEATKVLGGLDSFNKFRKQLKEEGAETMPVAEELDLVASGYDFF
jgi:hypothetical protein